MAEASRRFLFFASCALGAEDLLEAEIEGFRAFCLDVEGRPSTAPFQIVSRDKGGLEFEASLEVGYTLNHWLKTANRILLRIDRFPAKSPMRLQERLRSADLKTYFGTEAFRFQVEATTCQIHNEKQIRRWAGDIWDVNEDSDLTLLLRGVNDEWTLSIDTSGEHLHKRGQRRHAGAAPLRETLAAISLRMLCQNEPWQHRTQVSLLDPMAGAGTFLREAWQLDRPVTSRTFSFQKLKNCPKILRSEAYWKNLSPEWRLENVKDWGQLIAADQDADMEPLLQSLATEIGVQFRVLNSFTQKTRADWAVPEAAPLWIILNPPYGERLAGLEWVQALPAWVRGLRAEKLLLWCPEKIGSSVRKAFAQAPQVERFLSNGGIDCAVMLFSFPTHQARHDKTADGA